MHPAQVVRLVLGDEALQKIRDSPASRSVLAFARGERPGDERKKSAINEGIAIDEKQSRAVWSFHGVNIKRPRFGRRMRACIWKNEVVPRLLNRIYRCLRAFRARNSDSLGLVSLHLPVSS